MLNSSMRKENYKQNSMDTNLALALYKLDVLQEKVESIETVIKQDYVTKAEFEPVKTTFVSKQELANLEEKFKPSNDLVWVIVKKVIETVLVAGLVIIGLKTI